MKSASVRLYERWMKHDPQMTKRVMSQEMCDIEPEFMCFAEIYEALAKIIPKHWTVIDIGCAYASQCLYFRDHASYLGIEPESVLHFCTKNTAFLRYSIMEWQKTIKADISDIDKVFAIMSYVPADEESYSLVKTTFKNMFLFYPSSHPIKISNCTK